MSKVNAVSQDILFSWVSKALEKENFGQHEISLDGTSEKCDGYIGEIVFVNVKGTTKENEEKTLHLVVKHNKENEHIRASALKIMFLAEIHFYDKVYPAFQKFQSEKNLPVTFSAVPKCLKTFTLHEKEVLIFENLKKQGFELYNRKKPLNLFHMKAVLEQLGKLHALSFALRDQRRAEFEAIVANYPNFTGTFLTDKMSKGAFTIALDKGMKALQNFGELELLAKLKKLISENGDDPADIMAKLVDADEPQSVVVHGDGWSNNFLFKYKGNNTTTPCDVILLDWQVSHLRSPAIDLSYFFYSTASSNELNHFEQLMKSYYTSFSSFLRALGSDPEELFPFDDLKRHWKKYSMYGMLFSPLLLPFIICDMEEAPAFEDMENADSFEKMLIIDLTQNEMFYQRFRDVVRHYFQCTF